LYQKLYLTYLAPAEIVKYSAKKTNKARRNHKKTKTKIFTKPPKTYLYNSSHAPQLKAHFKAARMPSTILFFFAGVSTKPSPF